MTREQALQKLTEVARLKHLSLATEETYRGWLGRFCAWAAARPDLAIREAKVEAFLTDLAKGGCAASTQNQALCAVLFFYRHCLNLELSKVDALRARRPAMVRTAPTPEEVRALLSNMADLHGYPTRLIARLIYGCGMRVCEPLNLRVKDLVLSQSRMILRGAKGGKDRVIAIPCSLVGELQAQLRAARVVWEADARHQIPVALPGLLAKKYPHWQFSWTWAFVFPSHKPCADPRTGQTVRWRCHEANVQRAVKEAARRLGLCVTPHHLRHAYATHVMQRGANIRDVQAAMGHEHMETTAGYLTPQALSVLSPLEA